MTAVSIHLQVGADTNLDGEIHAQDSMTQPNSCWSNFGGEFHDKASEWGFDSRHITRGSVVADLDNDGLQDLIVSHVNAPTDIYWGDCMNGDWLSLEIEMEGMNSKGVGA